MQGKYRGETEDDVNWCHLGQTLTCQWMNFYSIPGVLYHCYLPGMHACILWSTKPTEGAWSKAEKRIDSHLWQLKEVRPLLHYCQGHRRAQASPINIHLKVSNMLGSFSPCPLPISRFKEKDIHFDIPQQELEYFVTEEIIIFDLICSTNEAKIFLNRYTSIARP